MLNFAFIIFETIIFKHPLSIIYILVTLLVFHFEISGKDDNDEHPINILLILVTLLVFHFEISGKDDNDEHLLNILFILITYKYSILKYQAKMIMMNIH